MIRRGLRGLRIRRKVGGFHTGHMRWITTEDINSEAGPIREQPARAGQPKHGS